ncbi:SDR family NAD(P)-dependent oxidoreductase [uncultured Alsobacter sp.]|uniref:SDR family NAD(P)-dependent oxidoreductase n=1 Tax=uncultured Alsobacter sp. TaxID=1748258 RepID=UPI0025FA162B|nr:SDR family oxidoreductase [uncultured Alsobacter sp.]
MSATAAHTPPVVVTGAAGDIGQAVVRRLQADGRQVIGSDLCPRPAALGDLTWHRTDLAGAEGWAALADAIEGPLSGFVHVAGIVLTQSIDEITEADWDRCFAVHVKAPFFMTRALSGRLEAGASVVLVGTVAARRASPENLVYGATKAALASMAASLSVSFATRGVRINVVAPGLIDTQLTHATTQKLSALRGTTPEATAKARVAGIPMGRAGEPDEVAGAVAWLLSRDSSYVTGTTIMVGGGLLAGSV